MTSPSPLLAMFAVLLTGTGSAVATAASPDDTQTSLRIELNDGHWIEFAGIEGTLGDDSETTTWLPTGRTSGDAIAERFRLDAAPQAGEFLRTFLFRASVPDDVQFALKADGGIAAGNSQDAVNGTKAITLGQVARFKDGQASTTVRLNVAVGPWKTVATGSRAGGVQNGVRFLSMVYRGAGMPPVVAVVPTHVDEIPDVRLVAEDNSRTLHLPTSFSKHGVANGTELKAAFAPEVDEAGWLRFHLQTRGYATLEFRNVALHPRDSHDVEVLLAGKPIDLDKPLSADALNANIPEPLTAELDDDGSVVELIGTTVYPNPSGWWGADGRPLPLDRKPAYAPTTNARDANHRRVEMVWRTRLPSAAVSDGYVVIDGDELTSRQVLRKGTETPDGSLLVEHVVLGEVLHDRESIDVTVQAAWGDWNPVAELPVKVQPYEDGNFYEWLNKHRSEQPFEAFVFLTTAREGVNGKDDRVVAQVVFDEQPGLNYRVVMVDKSGEPQPLVLTNGTRNVRSAGFKIAPSKVEAFHLERRPFRVAKYRNLSLWKDIPTSAYVVEPKAAAPASESSAPLSAPSHVLHTDDGRILTLPRNADLERRITKLQQRGARLKFSSADKEIIARLRQLNDDEDPDTPKIVNVAATGELEFLSWRGVPADELPLLSAIAGLDQLELSTDATAQQLSVLTTLTGLRKLSLGARGAKPAIFVIIGRLTELEDLRLSGGRFRTGSEDFEARYLLPLRNLKQLRELEMSDVDFTDDMLAHLAGLTNLELLYTGNSVTVSDQGLAHLSNLKNLESLVLHRIMTTDKGLAFLAGLPKLEWLVIPSDRYTDAAMQHLASMPNLGRVDLSGSQVTDAGAAVLATAKSLRKADLRNTRVTRAGVDVLKTAHPKMEILWGKDRPVVGSRPSTGLSLHIAPELGENNAPLTLTAAHVESLKAELRNDGPTAAAKRQQHFQWYRVRNEDSRLPITENRDDRLFALLPAQSDWIMRAYLLHPKVVSVRLQASETANDTWDIALDISERSAAELAEFTDKYKRRQLAVTVDDQLLVAPLIRSSVGRRLVISGSFSRTDAESVAASIATGAEIEVE